MKELDEFIEQFEPERTRFSVSDSQNSLADEKLLRSALSPHAQERDEDRLERLIGKLDEEYGEDSIRSAISDYYEHREDGFDFDGEMDARNPPGTSAASRTDSWGYVQVVAFSFVTASYLLDDYLKRNDLRTAYTEAQRFSWLLPLTLALMKYV